MGLIYYTGDWQEVKLSWLLSFLVTGCVSIVDNDYYSGGDDEFGFEDVDSQDAQLPIDKLDTYIQSDNTYTR